MLDGILLERRGIPAAAICTDLFVPNGGVDSALAYRSVLYHNNRDGSFTKVTEGSIVTEKRPWITGAWEEWTIPLSELTAGGVNLSSVKKVTIGVGDKVSPKAGGTGKLYIDDLRLIRAGGN